MTKTAMTAEAEPQGCKRIIKMTGQSRNSDTSTVEYTVAARTDNVKSRYFADDLPANLPLVPDENFSNGNEVAQKRLQAS